MSAEAATLTKEKSGKTLTKIGLALSAIGPGLFLIAYDTGTGSIVTMAKSGAEYGMALFWVLALSSVFTYVLMVAYGQVTIVTGRTALSNFRHNFPRFHIGDGLSLYIIAALVLGEILALIGIMGIVTDLLQEGTRLLFGGSGFSAFLITVALVAALYALVWYGRYQVFEKVLAAFVFFMAISFILVFFLVEPDLGVILSGMVPHIPAGQEALTVIAAIAGTSVSAAVFVVRSILVAEKEWKIGDLHLEKRDALVSATVMLFLSGIIMAVAAGTLYVMGLGLDTTLELIHLFEPLGGEVAAFILILGISAAGISTLFPIILIAPWLVADFTGRSRDIKSPLFRILSLAALLFAFVMHLLDAQPPVVMVFSQAFQALILPAVVIPIMILINRDQVMQSHTAGLKMNAGLIAALLFSFMTAYFALEGLM